MTTKYTPLIFALIVLILIPIAPLLFIWAVNTLFGTGITYTFLHWLAALVLLIIVQSGHSSSEK